MAKLPTFVDLKSLAAAVSDDPGLRPLIKHVRKATHAHSCGSDLAQALSCCHALSALLASPRKQGTPERAATESSLLMAAVLLYTRATATNGGRGERGSSSITSHLTPDQLRDHDAIVSVRNRALAHVYEGEIVADDVWHEDAVFLVQAPEGGMRPCTATRRRSFNRQIFEALRRQIPIAKEILKALGRRHLDAAIAIINEGGISQDALRAHVANPRDFFETEARVWAVLQMAVDGEGAAL